MNYSQFFQEKIQTIQNEGRYRVFTSIARDAGHFPQAVNLQPKQEEPPKNVTVWCSNDYLAMGQHPKVLNALHRAASAHGAGAGGTRNIAGTGPLHGELEAELAALHKQDSALLFPCGYLANLTALSTLGSQLPDCVIFSDEKNHASMIEGVRHSRAQKEIWAHNALSDLESKLKKYPREQAKLIAFESVYSMDGTIAPIEKICDLAEKYNALTYVDEVHAVGLYGAHGGGVTERDGVAERLDIIQGTLAKAYGVIGGYITGDHSLIDFIRSSGSGFIFTTALGPAQVAAALASVRHVRQSSVEREALFENVHYLKGKLLAAGLPLMETPSHIVPVLVGEAKHCKQITDALLRKYNIYVQPINYPTVPKGTERLRLTPSPEHTKEHCDQLVNALADLWAQCPENYQEMVA